MARHKEWYYALMRRAIGRPWQPGMERHHIVPRCFGGEDALFNVVNLTPREHLVAHKLLARFEEGKAKRLMQHALMRLTFHNPNWPSWRYAEAREAARQARLGVKASNETRAKQRAAKLGGKHTEEHKAKIAEANRRREHTWGDKISAAKQAKKEQCPHCLRMIAGRANMAKHLAAHANPNPRAQRKLRREARRYSQGV